VSPNVSAKADIKLPDTAIISVAQTLSDRWQLLGDLSWTGWSSVQKVNIIRTSGAAAGTIAQTLDADFRDTWRIALGGVYKYDPAWDIKFGVAYDQSPVRSVQQRLVSLPDNDRYWLTGGAQWRPTKDGRVDFGAAYLFVRDTNIDNNQTLLGRGRVTGSYDSSVWILGAQYSQAF
jgi:long-chain fatty acid transport protein